MKHVRQITIPRMAVAQKDTTYKQDTIWGPLAAVAKLLPLVAGAGYGIYALVNAIVDDGTTLW